MCHMAINTTFGSKFPVFVKDFDVFNERATPTYFLLRQLSAEVPENTFFFVLGSDILPNLRNWEEGEKLLNEFTFLIMERPGYPIRDHELPAHYEFLARPDITISITKLSSSEIRRRIQMDISLVDGLIPPSVLAHIIRNHLYARALHTDTDEVPLGVISPRPGFHTVNPLVSPPTSPTTASETDGNNDDDGDADANSNSNIVE